MYMYNGDTVKFSIKWRYCLERIHEQIVGSHEMAWTLLVLMCFFFFVHIFFKNGFPPDIHHGNT